MQLEFLPVPAGKGELGMVAELFLPVEPGEDVPVT